MKNKVINYEVENGTEMEASEQVELEVSKNGIRNKIVIGAGVAAATAAVAALIYKAYGFIKKKLAEKKAEKASAESEVEAEND